MFCFRSKTLFEESQKFIIFSIKMFTSICWVGIWVIFFCGVDFYKRQKVFIDKNSFSVYSLIVKSTVVQSSRLFKASVPTDLSNVDALQGHVRVRERSSQRRTDEPKTVWSSTCRHPRATIFLRWKLKYSGHLSTCVKHFFSRKKKKLRKMRMSAWCCYR
jgi:hypothetical protein